MFINYHRKSNTNKSQVTKPMPKAKENWIGKQCSEIEENLRKNNSKRAYQLMKDLTTVKQGKVHRYKGKIVQENASQKRDRY